MITEYINLTDYPIGTEIEVACPPTYEGSVNIIPVGKWIRGVIVGHRLGCVVVEINGNRKPYLMACNIRKIHNLTPSNLSLCKLRNVPPLADWNW